jgi:hypothetical protein
VPVERESKLSLEYRDRMNCEGNASEIVAGGYVWRPSTELVPQDLQQ